MFTIQIFAEVAAVIAGLALIGVVVQHFYKSPKPRPPITVLLVVAVALVSLPVLRSGTFGKLIHIETWSATVPPTSGPSGTPNASGQNSVGTSTQASAMSDAERAADSSAGGSRANNTPPPKDRQASPGGGSMLAHHDGQSAPGQERLAANTQSSGVASTDPKAGTAGCTRDDLRQSITSGARARITFVNKSGAVREIAWNTTDGKRQRLAVLGTDLDQYTADSYVGHNWTVSDTNGRCIGVYTVHADGQTEELH